MKSQRRVGLAHDRMAGKYFKHTQERKMAKKTKPNYLKENKEERKHRIAESGNTYLVKVKGSKKVYNRKNKDWKRG